MGGEGGGVKVTLSLGERNLKKSYQFFDCHGSDKFNLIANCQLITSILFEGCLKVCSEVNLNFSTGELMFTYWVKDP